MTDGGGTYPNLFCAHPPFQIDGNFGGTAGIAEMLIQSHEGFVHYLPACPKSWNNGSFTGLRVRGGGEVSATWKNGEIVKATLQSTIDFPFKIKVPDGITRYINPAGVEQQCEESGYIDIRLRKGDEVLLLP